MLEQAFIVLALALIAGLVFDFVSYSYRLLRALGRAVRAFGADPRRRAHV
jgi:hypothetical protein